MTDNLARRPNWAGPAITPPAASGLQAGPVIARCRPQGIAGGRRRPAVRTAMGETRGCPIGCRKISGKLNSTARFGQSNISRSPRMLPSRLPAPPIVGFATNLRRGSRPGCAAVPPACGHATCVPARLIHDPDGSPPLNTTAPSSSHDYQPPQNPCTRCRLREDTLVRGACAPGDACLVVNSGRQIDRFLSRNREYAEACLDDPFWERRAIAVRWAPAEAAVRLIDDPDETVRRAVATRVTGDALLRLARDPDREVRVTVASRLPPELLDRLMGDADYAVRLQVARRLPHGRLPRMAKDPDLVVRKEVARRLPPFALSRMAHDPDPEIRAIAAARMLPDDAAGMLADPAFTVRAAAIAQAPLDAVRALLDDPEPDIRLLAAERCARPPES
ncbi:hypothetical protein E6O51_15290 [Pseudothauera rhizosphaerae]|uniref:Leucine rich repeat variant n=1 Tax=Pseudothauera rhizosphaerae TaxID=2565932 RepID=A0A4S4AJ00_9RHOO|nr:hypothetical protein E6O51_15290 [Pseudothauera rhizosphaerae]